MGGSGQGILGKADRGAIGLTVQSIERSVCEMIEESAVCVEWDEFIDRILSVEYISRFPRVNDLARRLSYRVDRIVVTLASPTPSVIRTIAGAGHREGPG